MLTSLARIAGQRAWVERRRRYRLRLVLRRECERMIAGARLHDVRSARLLVRCRWQGLLLLRQVHNRSLNTLLEAFRRYRVARLRNLLKLWLRRGGEITCGKRLSGRCTE